MKKSIVNKVWRKAKPVSGCNPKYLRRDVTGRIISRNQYGDRGHRFGWEVDHKTPKARGGGNRLSNLQPLNWKSNVEKGAKPYKGTRPKNKPPWWT